MADLARTLWPLLRDGIGQQKRDLALALGLALSSIGITLSAPYILQQIVDEVLPRGDSSLLLAYAGLLVSGYLLGVLLWAAQIRFSARASENIFCALRRKLVRRMLKKPIGFFNKFLAGDLLTRLANDLEFISEFFYQNLLRSLSFCLFSMVIVVVLVVWSWKLGLIALATLPLLLFYISRTHGFIASRAGVTKENLSSQNDVLVDILQGIKELRFFHQEDQAARRFDDSSRTYTESMIRATSVPILPRYSSHVAPGLEGPSGTKYSCRLESDLRSLSRPHVNRPWAQALLRMSPFSR